VPDQFLRPSPPFRESDAHYNLMASQVNDARLVAGAGIRVRKTSNGTTISLLNPGDAAAMNFKGTYNFTSSYNVNDVVYVDPNVTITDQNGNALPFGQGSGSLSPGLWICNVFVPALGIDDTLLTGSVAPTLAAAGQQVTSQVADQFRHYSLNAYYPTFPVQGPVSYVTESTWTTQTSASFWLPLATNTSGSNFGSQLLTVYGEQTSTLTCWGSGSGVNFISVLATGSGYPGTLLPLTISAPSSGITAVATASVSSGSITTVQVTNPGFGYTSPPTITAPSGSGAVLVAGNALVAKPPELRSFIGSVSGSVDTQGNPIQIMPPYSTGSSIIWAITPIGGTGLSVGGGVVGFSGSVIMEDINASARAVARLLPTCEPSGSGYVSAHRWFVCSLYQ
jgi:hypothetical protein